MSIYRNNAEGGANATAVTAGNSGGDSGNGFTAAGGMTFSNEQSAHGSLSYKDTPGSSSVLRWAISNDSKVSMRGYFRLGATTPTQSIARVSHATDTTAAQLQVNTANRLRLNAKSSTQLWVASADLPVNEWMRWELWLTQGSANNDGQAQIAYYLGDSTSPIEESPVLTGANFGGDLGLFTMARFGGEVATTTVPAYYDDLAVNTGADSNGFIGPVAPPPAPGSPFKRWNGDSYEDLNAFAWNGSSYYQIVTATP